MADRVGVGGQVNLVQAGPGSGPGAEEPQDSFAGGGGGRLIELLAVRHPETDGDANVVVPCDPPEVQLRARDARAVLVVDAAADRDARASLGAQVHEAGLLDKGAVDSAVVGDGQRERAPV